MMHEQCRATNADGTACNARPIPGRGWCQWHDPDLADKRRQNAIKGGRARSNEARARRALLGNAQDLLQVKAILMASLGKVGTGAMEPAQGQAMAAIAKAIVVVSQAGDLESRIAQLEAAALGRSA